MRPASVRPLFLLALLPLQALAADAQRPEVWACKGVRQTAPGEPLVMQERTLVLHGTGRAILKAEGAEYQGRFEASGPHVAAWFEWAGAGGEMLSLDATLALATGRLATSLKRKDGTQVEIFRGACKEVAQGEGAK